MNHQLSVLAVALPGLTTLSIMPSGVQLWFCGQHGYWIDAAHPTVDELLDGVPIRYGMHGNVSRILKGYLPRCRRQPTSPVILHVRCFNEPRTRYASTGKEIARDVYRFRNMLINGLYRGATCSRDDISNAFTFVNPRDIRWQIRGRCRPDLHVELADRADRVVYHDGVITNSSYLERDVLAGVNEHLAWCSVVADDNSGPTRLHTGLRAELCRTRPEAEQRAREMASEACLEQVTEAVEAACRIGRTADTRHFTKALANALHAATRRDTHAAATAVAA